MIPLCQNDLFSNYFTSSTIFIQITVIIRIISYLFKARPLNCTNYSLLYVIMRMFRKPIRLVLSVHKHVNTRNADIG